MTTKVLVALFTFAFSSLVFTFQDLRKREFQQHIVIKQVLAKAYRASMVSTLVWIAAALAWIAAVLAWMAAIFACIAGTAATFACMAASCWCIWATL
jgi:hypothetical protein